MGRTPPIWGALLPSKGSNSIFFFSLAPWHPSEPGPSDIEKQRAIPRSSAGRSIPSDCNSPDSASSHDSSSRLNLCQSPRHILPGVLIILQLSREITFVRTQVEVAVPAEAEQDDARPPFLAGEQRFVHRGADGVGRFRRRQNALAARESHRGFEHRQLANRSGLDLAEFQQMTEQWRRAVIAQPAGVNSGRHKIVAQGVHLDQRRQFGGIAAVVGEAALGEAGTGGRLHGDDPGALARQPVQDVGQGEPGEIAAAAEAADQHLGFLARLLHLQLGFLADHGLVEHHVIQHAAQRVIGVVVGGRILDRLADGDPQAARRIGRRRQHSAAGMGMVARAGENFGAPDVHHHAAVWLLVVTAPHHVHGAFHAEKLACQGQRAAPLPRPGFGGQPLDARALVVVRLRHRGIRLVAAGRTGAFVFEIDARRRIKQLLQAARRKERGGPPQAIDIHHFARDIDQRLGGKLLLDQFHRKERRQILRRQRRASAWMKRWGHGFRQRRQDIDPDGGNLAIGQQEFRMLRHGRDYYNRPPGTSATRRPTRRRRGRMPPRMGPPRGRPAWKGATDYPTMTTVTWPGPCTPRTRICSMSAVRLGPVISTMELVTAAGSGSRVNSSSKPVRMRSTGTTARCAGGNSDTRRDSAGLAIMTSVPVSLSAKSALVMPISTRAHTSVSSPTSRIPLRTPGSRAIPHSSKSGAFDATAVLPAMAAATNSRAASMVGTRAVFPASASTRDLSRAMRSSMATWGTRRRTGGTSATACPALRPSAVRTLCRMLSRDISAASTSRGNSWVARAAGRAG